MGGTKEGKGGKSAKAGKKVGCKVGNILIYIFMILTCRAVLVILFLKPFLAIFVTRGIKEPKRKNQSHIKGKEEKEGVGQRKRKTRKAKEKVLIFHLYSLWSLIL